MDWAHPEFGQIIASVSHDKSIKVWEQAEQESQMGRKWTERARLQDSNQLTTHMVFAPRFHGLRIGSCSFDGRVRMHEALDPLNVSAWTLIDDISLFEKKDAQFNSHFFCLSFCQTQTLPKMFIVATGKENTARIYKFDTKWTLFTSLKGHSDVILDVQWSPSFGKSYQLIATSCKDGFVRIFKFQSKPKVELIFEGAHTNCKSIEWNITGTVLSSCSDDGKLMIWKSNY